MFSLFAYFGPETSMPLASGLMAVAGFVFMMGRSCSTFVAHRFRGVGKLADSSDPRFASLSVRPVRRINRPTPVDSSQSADRA